MPNRLGRERAEFEQRIAESESFVNRCKAARSPGINRPALVTSQVEWAHEVATLKLVVASEQFFETTLGLYVLGKRTPTGYRVRRLRTIASSLPAVLDVFTGDQDYLGWNSPTVIIERAERWLKGGGPYQGTLSSASQILVYLKKMRNAIAHDSDNARKEYQQATRRLYGALPRRVCPGAQLIQPPPPGISYLVGASLFESVVGTYRLIAKQIVP